MERSKVRKWMKVTPHSKTADGRTPGLESSVTWRKAQERGQNWLYVASMNPTGDYPECMLSENYRGADRGDYFLCSDFEPYVKEAITPEKLLTDTVVKFFNENFDKVKYDLADANLPKTKSKFLKVIQSNVQDVIWALTELASWGMDKDGYLKELYVETPDLNFTVLKIGDKYIKMTMSEDWIYHLEFTEPKTKTITYFE